jgi:magnesium-protoporphyrin O-methyltransferase
VTTSCCSHFSDAVAGQFNAANAESDLKRYRRKGPNSSTRLLRTMVLRAGGGQTLLDIGGGIGALSFELLAAGMEHAILVDASSASLATARREAVERGDADHMTFLEGDAVLLGRDIGSAEVVVMDRVICCYPDVDPLLDVAFGHSVTMCALSFPRESWLARAVVGLENQVRKLRGNPFRVYLHPAASIDNAAQRHGFRCIDRAGTFAWRVRVYTRDEEHSRPTQGEH